MLFGLAYAKPLPMTTINFTALRDWMRAATADEQAELAALAGTSRNYLYQLAIGHRTARAEMAGAIEAASRALRAKNRALPVISRTALCAACAACPHAVKCSRKS